MTPNEVNVLEVLKHDFHFPGHLLPGFAFILLGTARLVNVFQSFLKKESEDKEGYLPVHGSENDKEKLLKEDGENYAICANYCGDVPGLLYCEGFYRCLYATVDLLCHLWVVYHGGVLVNEAQHIMIYVFFILEGVVNIIDHLRLKDGRTLFPPNLGTDYFLSSIPWLVFGFLFLSHKHGKNPTQIYFHSLLACVALLVGVLSLMMAKSSILTGTLWGISTILSGTWLFQIAFTFHNPYSNNEGSKAIMTMGTMDTDKDVIGVMKGSTIFTQHLFIVLLFSAAVFKWCEKSMDKDRKGREKSIICSEFMS